MRITYLFPKNNTNIYKHRGIFREKMAVVGKKRLFLETKGVCLEKG